MAAYNYDITIDKVIDGDTIDVTIDLGFGVKMKHRVRLYGINTAEIHSSVLEERALGLQAKDYVTLFAKNTGPFTMESFKPDKYGRYLGKIYLGDRCLNDELIQANLAKPYFGEGVKNY